MKTRVLFAATLLAMMPLSAFGQMEEGQQDFMYVSELAREGFVPFPASNAANASFGMMKGDKLYLCFVADNAENQSTRQQVIITALADADAPRAVPNIPMVCVLTE